MGRVIFLLAALFAGSSLKAQQQSPLYLLYNSGCMNQLEYRYAYSGATVLSYTFNPNADKTIVLNAGNSGINSPALPPGTLNCQEIRIDQAFLDAVNKLQRQVYMVHQAQQGYLLMPLISATQIERTGSYYFIRSPNHQFALDTSNLVYQANLASAGSPNFVYFNGLQIRDCVYQYSFRSEPSQYNREKSDFTFIPGIGIVTSNSGLTASEMEANTLRLWYVNGMNLEDYIRAHCNPDAVKNAGKIPVYVADERVPEKKGELPARPAPGRSADCPEQSGEGYHIVEQGQTLLGISRSYKVSLKNLVSWNKIDNPDRIEPCQKIYVKKPAAQPAPAFVAKQPAPQIIGETSPRMVPVHLVQPGETLSGIARMYGFTEARFRQINNLPPSGELIIRPGQQFMVSDCGQPVMNQQSLPSVNYSVPANFNASPPVMAPGATTQPIPQSPPPSSAQPSSALPFSIHNTEPAPKIDPGRKTTYYQEYVVQQGDTMNSVAIKFNTSVQELALLNSKATNEILIAGQRILIPKR